MRDLADPVSFSSLRARPAAASPGFDARGLTFRAGGSTLVDGIDFSLSGGGITAILGPNGAGKSVLLRLLHGLLEPSDGTLLWRGRELDKSARTAQAMVFQRPVLLRRSVAANMEFVLRRRGVPRSERKAGIARHLRNAGLLDKAAQSARTLSGGEQQRLSVARALACNPETLFLDEPTASLDPAATQTIEQMVRAAADAGTKIVLVSHDPGQTRRLASDVLLLNRGRVEEHSSADLFFSEPASQAGRSYLSGGLLL